MAADFESPWNDLLSDIRGHQVHFKQGTVACWDEAIADLESEWPGSNDQVEEISRAMDVRKYLLLDSAEDIYDYFNDCLSDLRIDTLTWLSGSMITRIMSRVCREALEHHGPGSNKRQQGVVKGTFANEATFESMTRHLRRCFKDLAEGLQQELGDLVSTHLGAMRATLDIVREVNAAEESGRDPEFLQRVAGEVASIRSLMGI
ncbi:hypothetical protein VPNG_03093 [Cytospora leucostoma]|uniref:DUF7605 domain-containing protein n=1 Tax=Cytospora leucostoma TaxID=1230097 RepID=A0A423XFZ9_9PEZI|nr:hypothetical protein VPNG_03093 [Cytospora leucostoma]